MARTIVDTAKLEEEYNGKKNPEYKGKADYAQRKNMEDLAEYSKMKLRAGVGGPSLYSMGQESLAWHRYYQQLLDKHEAEKLAGEKTSKAKKAPKRKKAKA